MMRCFKKYKIQIPPRVNDYTELCFYKDSLSIVIPDTHNCFEGWVMNDIKYWAKHLTFGLFCNTPTYHGLCKNDVLSLEYRFNRGRLILRGLLLYEHSKKEIRDLQIIEPKHVFISKN